MLRLISASLTIIALHVGATEPVCPWPEAGSQQQRYHQQLSCFDQELLKARRELEQWEKHHEFALQQHRQRTGRPAALNSYRNAKESFQQLKEQHCRWQYQLQLPDVQAGAALYKQCQLKLITQRTADLESLAAR